MRMTQLPLLAWRWRVQVESMRRKWVWPTTSELGRGPWAPGENCSPSWYLDFSLVRPQTENRIQLHHTGFLTCRNITLPTEVLYSQSYGFSNSQVRMWEFNHKKGWGPKNWCFRTVALEKTWESLGDSLKEIKPVNPKGNQPWIFIGRTDAETKAPILWPPDAKSWLIWKDPDAGKDWGQEEKGAIEDEMVGWHHWLNGHEFEQTLGDSEGQGSLACCSPGGCKESDMT